MTSSYCFHNTPAGKLLIKGDVRGITETIFVEENAQAPSNNYDPALANRKLAPIGTPFQQRVWQAVQAVPAGKTVTYEELAHAIGAPKAYRAVANALGANPISYFIPCHRVLRKDGSLGGYAWGIERKKALLAAEKTLKVS